MLVVHSAGCNTTVYNTVYINDECICINEARLLRTCEKERKSEQVYIESDKSAEVFKKLPRSRARVLVGVCVCVGVCMCAPCVPVPLMCVKRARDSWKTCKLYSRIGARKGEQTRETRRGG